MSSSQKSTPSGKKSTSQKKIVATNNGKKTNQNSQVTGMQPRIFNASAPAALASNLLRGLGMDDIRGLRIGYLAGYIYVGNGVEGVANSVFFIDANKTDVFTSPVPILPSDAAIGQSYIADVFKHFMRRRYRRILLHLLSLIPATSNSMVVNLAPVRGGNILPTVSAAAGAAALSQAGVMGMKGHGQISSWQSGTWDLSSFVAGGGGATQDEFNQAISAAAESSPAQASVSLASPCGFAVSGLNASTGLEGLETHAVIVELVVDLLDFVASILPGGVVAGSRPFVPTQTPVSNLTGRSSLTDADVKTSEKKLCSHAVHASSRLSAVDEDYVSLTHSSPIGGVPLRDPSRIESRKL